MHHDEGEEQVYESGRLLLSDPVARRSLAGRRPTYG
jgi:hypothetical protein